MADVEKVMAGLECCDKLYGDHEGCPYDHKDQYGDYENATCILALIHDAKEVLTEQVSLIHFLKHQRQKGHWVFGSSNGHSWMKCSQCLVSQDGQTACFSFCPNCGASMEEEPEHMT